MQLTVIGCSPAWPNAGGAQSGYLVEGEGRLLLDCGPGVLARLREHDGSWPRIDALFDDVQGRLDQHAARLTVEYDPTLGYPRSIVVDVAAMAVDDEYSHTAGNLRPLP